jgi:hypothetical protein
MTRPLLTPDIQTEADTEPLANIQPELEPETHPKWYSAISSYVVDCKRYSETQKDRTQMVERVRDHRMQYNGTYRLKHKTQLNGMYLANISGQISTIISNLTSGIANVLQMSERVVQVRPDDGRRLDEIKAAWTEFVATYQQLKAASLDPGIDIATQFESIVAAVDERLQREGFFQELRMSKGMRDTGIGGWLPKGLQRSMIDGTVIPTVGISDGKVRVRLIDCLNYFPSASHLPTIGQQTWRIEQDTLSWFDIQDFRAQAADDSTLGYAFLDEIKRDESRVAANTAENRKHFPGVQETRYGADLDRLIFIGRIDFEFMLGDDWQSNLSEIAAKYGFADQTDAMNNAEGTLWHVEVLNDEIPIRFLPMPKEIGQIPDVRWVYNENADGTFWGHSVYDQGGSDDEKIYNLLVQLTTLLVWQQLEPQGVTTNAALSARQNKDKDAGWILPFQPGRMVGFQGWKVDDLYKADRPPAEVLVGGFQALDRSEMRNEKRTGATAAVQGMSPASGTATSASINLKQGTTRFVITAWTIDQDVVHPIIDLIDRMMTLAESSTSGWDIDSKGNIVQIPAFDRHEWIVRIAQAASVSGVTAQLLMNLAGTAKDQLDFADWLRQVGKQLQIELPESLIDKLVAKVKNMVNQNQLIEQQIQNILLSSQLQQMQMAQAQGIPPQAILGPPDQGAVGNGNGGGGAGGQLELGQEGGGRMRSRANPANEMDMQNSTVAATTRQANPGRKI